jgi:hypothetical protein
LTVGTTFSGRGGRLPGWLSAGSGTTNCGQSHTGLSVTVDIAFSLDSCGLQLVYI